MEDTADVAWKRLEETLLLPEAPPTAAAHVAIKARAGEEIIAPLQDQKLELQLFKFPKFNEASWAPFACNRAPQKRHFPLPLEFEY